MKQNISCANRGAEIAPLLTWMVYFWSIEYLVKWICSHGLLAKGFPDEGEGLNLVFNLLQPMDLRIRTVLLTKYILNLLPCFYLISYNLISWKPWRLSESRKNAVSFMKLNKVQRIELLPSSYFISDVCHLFLLSIIQINSIQNWKSKLSPQLIQK